MYSEKQCTVLPTVAMSKTSSLVWILTQIFLGSVFVFLLFYSYQERHWKSLEYPRDIQNDLESFMNDWCRIRKARVDVDLHLRTCKTRLAWTDILNTSLRTDASQSFISHLDIKPAGEFSRFTINTKTLNGSLKQTGGDTWRIFLRGPSTIAPSVFDVGNGKYEALFLVVEPGVYKLDITLDYSLCNGYRNPPDNWFIIGNEQGKMQKDGVLDGKAKEDYLLQPFQNGKLIMINVPLPVNGGLFVFNNLPKIHDRYSVLVNLTCGIQCNLMWDGYGRWIDDVWKPYLSEIKWKNEDPPNVKTKPKFGKLLIYGDSQADRLYQSLQNTSVCADLFKYCAVRKMWVYGYTSEFPKWDKLDFNYSRIVADLRKELENPNMDENSVLILNLGLHYVDSTNFTNYQMLITRVIKLLKEKTRTGDGKETLKHPARIIWKTSTAISKEKDSGSQLFSDRRRFFTLPRVELFNAHATKAMCEAGFEVFDVYPFTRAYPYGTGGPEVGYYKEEDIVHFKFYVMKPLDHFLEEYLLARVAKTIDFKNYFFA